MRLSQYWDRSGTKLLGYVSAFFSSVLSALGAVSASPNFSLLVTPRQFAWLCAVNVALGGMVVRRGYTNTKARRRRARRRRS